MRFPSSLLASVELTLAFLDRRFQLLSFFSPENNNRKLKKIASINVSDLHKHRSTLRRRSHTNRREKRSFDPRFNFSVTLTARVLCWEDDGCQINAQKRRSNVCAEGNLSSKHHHSHTHTHTHSVNPSLTLLLTSHS